MAPSTSPQPTSGVATEKVQSENINKRSSTRVSRLAASVNQELLELLDIVRRRCDLYSFFSRPVDPVKDACMDYFDVIRKEDAMDLQTLESLIRSCEVTRIEEFEDCIARIIHNARTYNEDELNFVRIQTEKFASEFENIMKEMRCELSSSYSSEKPGTEYGSTAPIALETTTNLSSRTKSKRVCPQSMNKNSDPNPTIHRKSNRTSPKKRRFEDIQLHSTPKPFRDENKNGILLNASSIAARQGSSLNYIQTLLIDLLRSIRRTCDPHSLFCEPVDPVEDNCEDYFDVIPREKAMDLGTIENMIRDGELLTIESFEKLVHQIIDNARTYNEDEDNFVRIQTEKFASLVQPLIDRQKSKFKSLTKRHYQNQKMPKQVESDYEIDDDTLESGFSADDRSRSSSISDHESSRRKSSRRVSYEQKNEKSSLRKRSQRKSIDRKVQYIEEGSDSDLSQWLRRFPCRAQGLHSDHNSKSAYFVVTDETEHGSSMECSYPNCRKNGIKFLYCSYCELPVSKTNFHRLHRHSNTSANDANEIIDGVSSRHRYIYTSRDAAIPGASIPPTKKDLSTSKVVSVIEREAWKEIVPEMLVVCNEAARRAKLVENPLATRYDKPLSETYIEERLQYDNPLRGYIVRSNDRNDLQGFIVSCNFMVFRETFRWDSSAPQAGITPADRREHRVDDGNITSYLASSHVIGNVDDGLVFDRVAEISLLGGLGCGGALLQRALNDLNESGNYDFVVLQATKMAIPFYEKHGFVRVGAVARFEDDPDCPEVSYRHWGDIVRGRAVEASYMMAQKLPKAKLSKSHQSPNSASVQPITNLKDTPRTAQKKFVALRAAETIESLSIARSLAKEALELVTNTTVGQSSYIELLSLSREAIKSARGQGKLIKEIQRALQSFKKEECDSISKSIVRSAFNFGEKCVRTYVSVNGKKLSDAAVVAWVPMQKCTEIVQTELGLQFDEEPIEREFSVDVKMNGHTFSDPIRANVCSHHLSLDNQQSKEAMATVFHLFAKIAFGQDKVRIGDTIMVPSRTESGIPTWRVAEVGRKCVSSDKKKLPNGVQLKNSYVCIVDNGDSVIVEIDGPLSSRGVGRKWCTIGDWAAFSTLPLEILDTLLIGAFIENPGTDEGVVKCVIRERVGGGLKNGPLWRVVLAGKGRKGKGNLLSTSELRDFVQISQDSMERSYKMVTSSLEKIPPEPRIGVRGMNEIQGHQSALEPTWLIPRLNSKSDSSPKMLNDFETNIKGLELVAKHENNSLDTLNVKNDNRKHVSVNVTNNTTDISSDVREVDEKRVKRSTKDRRRVLRKRDNYYPNGKTALSYGKAIKSMQVIKHGDLNKTISKRKFRELVMETNEVILPRKSRIRK